MNQPILCLVAIFMTCNLFAQKHENRPLLKSWPLSFTPLSIWNSDVSASVGTEYRFHPSFSVRTAADYIYGGYSTGHAKTSGLRLREDIRYYIAGNRLINSRSRVWPYIAITGGFKYVRTGFSDWYWQNNNGQMYAVWHQYHTINREWFLLGRTGMQSAFGRNKRFLFDISLGLGVSNNRVSYHFPENMPNTDILLQYTTTNISFNSRNRFSGRFTGFNFEACFGYRLLK
ncbi:MAG: hypothetical protein KIT80_06065 [Chitinophagaceae bacterium]|nr:hypothetical protein [Chitinophagaceae bacterium]MCW5926459.1 hypothetical protein [Chitinophagaceae bacterium]